ncbi:MAG: hypothetical protein Q9170_007246 [Blastenia crenularia]
MEPSQPTCRKRTSECEGNSSSKRLRGDVPFPSEPAPILTRLTKEALKMHNRQVAWNRPDGAKCTGSHEDTASSRSRRTYTLGNYRWQNLRDARIIIEQIALPQDVELRVDAITQPDLSMGRKEQLSLVTKTLVDDLVRVMKGEKTEDDTIVIVRNALGTLDSDNAFMLPRKARTVPPIQI